MTSSETDIDESVLLGFLEESSEALAGLSPLFVQLEKDPENKDLVNAIFRPIHSIKGNAPFFGLMRLKTIAHEFESLLACMRSGGRTWGKNVFDLLLAGVDELREILERVAAHQPEVADEDKFRRLIEGAKQAIANGETKRDPDWASIAALFTKISNWELDAEKQLVVQELYGTVRSIMPDAVQKEIGSTKSELAETPEASNAGAPVSATGKQVQPTKTDGSKTMRVAEERIDTFLEFVGELVVAQDMLRYFSIRFEENPNDPDLSRDLGVIMDVISTLGSGLEKAIMSIRRVPVKNLLQKIPRIIRDIAQSKGKKIDVQIEGDDIEIDKSMLELLDAPLMHMARNAADHGIEAPDRRLGAGKKESGTVIITCEEHEKEIFLSVKDDGGGLNYDALKKKAESLQMISSDKALTEAQVINLLFMAGVSTATEVSDISGRGVGMDVVKKNIESAGGTIIVKSESGMGSAFSIRLPKSVTTQIMQGFVVEVGGVRYVLPLTSVQECWVLNASEATHVVGQGLCTKRYGHVLRVIDLGDVFGSESARTGDHHLVITLEIERQRYVFKIDDVLGARQLVLKPLSYLVNGSKMFLGGAILGDGGIALVCDLNKLIEGRSDCSMQPSHNELAH